MIKATSFTGPISILAALFVVCVIATASVPASACRMHYVDIFTQAERAETIAVGVVVPGGVDAENVLKGSERKSVHIHDWRGDPERYNSCVPRYSKGSGALVFVGENKRFVANYQSALRLDARAEDRDAMIGAIERWLKADDDKARLELLVELASGTDVKLAREASVHLIDRVEWFDDIGDTQRKALREALGRDERPTGSLAWLLMRLGDRGAGEILEKAQASAGLPSYEDLLGFLEHRNEDEVEDRDALAEVVENGPELMDRVAALDRCERELEMSLYRFSSYRKGVADHFWATLADACREGKPYQ